MIDNKQETNDERETVGMASHSVTERSRTRDRESSKKRGTSQSFVNHNPTFLHNAPETLLNGIRAEVDQFHNSKK